MIDPNRVCLISPLEQNKIAVSWDNMLHRRFFEQEAIRMASSWRKHGGWLKDIDIFFYNMNNASPAKSTIEELESLKCTIFHASSYDDKYLEIGFMTEPECGGLAEMNIDKDIFIKTDLDMQLLAPLDKELIEQAVDNVLIEQYTDFDAKEQRMSIGNFNPFDTCFIISSKNSKFYHHYLNLCSSDEVLKSKEWLSLYEKHGMYYIEEFVVDYMYKNCKQDISIKPMQRHLFGEGYKPVELMSDDEILDIKFMHSHIYANEEIKKNDVFKKLHQEYIKRLSSVVLKKNTIKT